MLFLQKSISFSAYLKASKKMEAESAKAALVYKSMLLKYPKYTALLSSYAFFLDLILRNSDEAMKYHRKAEEQRVREAEEAKANDGKGAPDTQGVIAITEEGLIEQVNKKLLTIFGQTRQNVMGRNIKILVPSPWKEHHDNFLSRYRTTNKGTVIGKPQRY
jgi:PAS domain-containing protein